VLARPDRIVAAATAPGPAIQPRPPSSRTARAAGRWAYRLAVGFALLVLISPLVLVVWLSLFRSEIPSVPPGGYTFHWYAAALSNRQFTGGLRVSFEVAVAATAVGLLVSVPAALALHRHRVPFSGFVLQLLMGPMVVPAIVVGASLYMSMIQVEIATDIPLVGSTIGLVAGHIVLTIPWCIRLLLANIVGVDRTVEEAASSLGARPLTLLSKVTMPLMWPGIVAAALFSFVVSFGNLEISLFLVAPGETTLPIAVLQYLQWRIDPSVAAISVVQIVTVVVGLLLTDRFVPITKVV